MEKVRIENTQARLLETPQLGTPSDEDNFYAPVRLMPGGNNVPVGLVEKLEKLDPAKGPGMVWGMWKDLGWVRVYSNAESRELIRKPEGPEAPSSLQGMAEKAAMVMVENETDVEVLMRWGKTERRSKVKAAIKSRLHGLELKMSSQPFGSEE